MSRPAAPPRNARYLGHMRKDPRILSEMADEHGGPRHQGDTDGDDDRKELAIEAPAHTQHAGQCVVTPASVLFQLIDLGERGERGEERAEREQLTRLTWLSRPE